MKKIVILISGRGSNMEALLDAVEAGELPVHIAAVISNRPDAAGLLRAAASGIPTVVVDHKSHTDRDAFDHALQTVINSFSPDLVVLAGFMRVLGESFVRHYENRLLNIHPSLLPAFTGLNTHERALAAGVRVHGCTVHFVTPTLDHGPIVLQAAVPVFPDDDAVALAERVLAAEHQIYKKAVRYFAEDRLSIEAGKVFIRESS